MIDWLLITDVLNWKLLIIIITALFARMRQKREVQQLVKIKVCTTDSFVIPLKNAKT